MSIRTLEIGLFYLLLFFGIAALRDMDTDFWWHLRTGKLIVETGSVPKADPFSFTSFGERWVDHEWLSQVLIYVVENTAGYAGNALLFTGLAVASLVVIHRLILKLGVSERVAIVLIMLAATIAVFFWTPRPQVFTWLFAALFLAALYQDYRDSRGQLWHLPVLMLFWSNLHAGYVIGLLLVGLWFLSLTGDRFIFRRVRPLGMPALVVAACFFAPVLNPNGLALLSYPLTYLEPGNPSLKFITEWRSPDFHLLVQLPVAAAIVLLALVGTAGAGRNLFRPLLAGVFTMMVLQSVRHEPLFALIVVLVVGDASREMWSWARRENDPPGRPSRPMHWVVLAGLVTFLLIGMQQLPIETQFRQEPRAKEYPVEGAAYLQAYYPESRVFNGYRWGGYLINTLYPANRVFVDGRADVHGEVVGEYVSVISLEPGWEDILTKYDIDLVLIERYSLLAHTLRKNPRWVEVFQGRVEAMFRPVE